MIIVFILTTRFCRSNLKLQRHLKTSLIDGNYINPNIHTNNIENQWKHLKHKVPKQVDSAFNISH